MLIAYVKLIEIDEIYCQYTTIKTRNLIKKLTNLNSITANRGPSSDNELANKKYVDDSIGDGNVLRFNRTLENYLRVSVGNDVYNIRNYDKI